MNIKLDAQECMMIIQSMSQTTIQGKDALHFGKVLEKIGKHFEKVRKAEEPK